MLGGEYRKDFGLLVRGGVSTIIGNGAVNVEVTIGGAKEREVFAQAGYLVTENTVVMVTFQNLEQWKNFIFPSGESEVKVSQTGIGVSGKIRLDKYFIKSLELQGYHIVASSMDLQDKEFIINTDTLFQILNDYRRLAGAEKTGIKLIIGFGSKDDTINLDLEV